MPIVDLSAAPPRVPASPEGAGLEGLPRRLAVTLPELRLLAETAGGAPLPFDVTASSLRRDRVGDGRDDAGSRALDDAYAEALAGLRDPVDSLHRRGLLTGGTADRELRSSLGVLARPALAVDLDVTVGPVRALAWHRQAGRAVATLSTCDGVVFELAWFATEQWARELALVAVLPEGVEAGVSEVPAEVDLPYELVDGMAEALRAGRTDLLPVLVAAHRDDVRGDDGAVLEDARVLSVVRALLGEARGRLRGLAAPVAEDGVPVVGVVSWLLLADGWRSLRTEVLHGVRRLRVERVEPADLAPLLAPLLAAPPAEAGS